jgi:hypothetical protein
MSFLYYAQLASDDMLGGGGVNDKLMHRLNEINANANIYNPAGVSTMQLISYAVEDASFLRLQNVTVGYTLPKKWVNKCYMQNVRIYFTGYNLLCFTNYSGYDPERIPAST